MRHASAGGARALWYLVDASTDRVGVVTGELLVGMEAERRAWARHWEPTISYLRRNGWQVGYHGLEVHLRRPENTGQGPLQFDLRYREKQGYDGYLKARLRFDGEKAPREAATLEKQAHEADLDSWVERVRRTDARPAWDTIMVTRCNRTAWIGGNDPPARLLDFGQLVLPLIHGVLNIAPPLR